MRAGGLDQSITIQRYIGVDDGYGNIIGTWVDQFTVWAGIQFMRGSETVIAARLSARQPAIMTVRNSAQARGILPSDRAKNAHTGELFNIREQPRESRDHRGYLEMMIEAGVAT